MSLLLPDNLEHAHTAVFSVIAMSRSGEAGASSAHEAAKARAAREAALPPALRHEGDHAEAEDSKRVRWDEEVIKEHDKDRGTRMKIDEPPTPYHQPGSVSDGEESMDDFTLGEPAVTFAQGATLDLSGVAAASSAHSSGASGARHARNLSGSSAGSADANPEPRSVAVTPAALVSVGAESGMASFQERLEEVKHKADFAKHRKNHYNEMEMLRKWREAHANKDEEDEDEDA